MIKGFITYINNTYDEGKTYINIFGRSQKGDSFHIRTEFQSYFFMKTEHANKAKDRIKLIVEDTNLVDFEGNKVSKILFSSFEDRKNVGEILKKEGHVLYEFDLNCEEQFLNQNYIYSDIEFEGEQDILGVYNNPKIKPSDSKVKLTIASIDIETSKQNKIISVSIYGDDVSEVYVVSKEKVKNAHIVKDEKELLITFIKRIKEIDPDIITGWNVIDFDLNMIKNRCKEHKIPCILGRTNDECRIMIFNDFFRDSIVNCYGRVVLDGISVLRSNFISLPDYKLDTAAKELIKDQKIDIMEETDDAMSKWDVIEHLYKTDKEKLAKYNLIDSKLVYDILKKDMLELLIKRSRITGMRIDKVKQSIRSLDSMYIKEAHKRGVVCYSSFNFSKEEPVQGAYVMKSKAGLYENLIVLDFKSLYPSIIRTYNIDPFTKRNDGKIVCANDVRFDDKKGILPKLIEDLWSSRDEAKKNKDNEGSWAFKITMNSFYGAIANPTCRFFSMELANAITQTSRATILSTIKLIEDWGYEVIYSDTDSIFVNTKCEKTNDALKIGKKIEKDVNKHITTELKNKFGVTSCIELEFEKTYKKFLMPSSRDSREGAKKRYAGLKIVGDNTKIDIVGMEYVRRDWTKLAKNLQWTLLEMLFNDKKIDEIKKHIKTYVDDLKKNKYDEDLIYSKSLNKPIEAYTKTTPPHVKAAKKMTSITSNIIKYVMTKDGPEPTTNQTSEIDYDHYIEKQLKPIANAILELFDEDFDNVIASNTQKTLFGF